MSPTGLRSSVRGMFFRFPAVWFRTTVGKNLANSAIAEALELMKARVLLLLACILSIVNLDHALAINDLAFIPEDFRPALDNKYFRPFYPRTQNATTNSRGTAEIDQATGE